MLRHAFVLLSLYLPLLFAAALLPAPAGRWLPVLTPLLPAYFALHGRDFPLVVLVVVGGMLHDWVLPHYFGMGPLLWGLVAFMIRSQRQWLTDASAIFLPVVGFAASFLYFGGDRLFLLFARQRWAWDIDFSFHILQQSIINAILCPVLFWLFDLLFGLGDRQQRKEEF